MYIANQTNQPVTYSSGGPGGGGSGCIEQPRKGPIPPGERVLDRYVKPGHVVCFFDLTGKNFLDQTGEIEFENFTVTMTERGAEISYTDRQIYEFLQEAFGITGQQFRDAIKKRALKFS